MDGAPTSGDLSRSVTPNASPQERGLEGSHQHPSSFRNRRQPGNDRNPLSVDPIQGIRDPEKQPNNGNLKALWGEHNIAKRKNGYGIDPAIWIDWVELEGPQLIPQKAESGTGLADVSPPTRRVVRTRKRRGIRIDFAVHAFRGVQPDPKFIDQLLSIHQTRREAGETFDVAIRTPLSVILAFPGSSISTSPVAKPNAELSQIANPPCASPTSSGALLPIRSCWLAQQNQLREPKIRANRSTASSPIPF